MSLRGTLRSCRHQGWSRSQASSRCWGSAVGTSRIHGTLIPFSHCKMLRGPPRSAPRHKVRSLVGPSSQGAGMVWERAELSRLWGAKAGMLAGGGWWWL